MRTYINFSNVCEWLVKRVIFGHLQYKGSGVDGSGDLFGSQVSQQTVGLLAAATCIVRLFIILAEAAVCERFHIFLLA